MQTEKEYIAAREALGLRSESVGEYSLPDYNGDVKKVLAVKTKVFPSGKFVGDETLEFSGTVGYDVVYVDGEGAVTHAEFVTDYDAALRINSESYADSDIHTEVSSCNVRLVGPRKFSVKTVLESDVFISEKKMHRITGDAFMEYEPEFLSRNAKVMSMEFAASDTREVEEEMTGLDGAIADEVEILLCDASGEVQSFEKNDHSVTVKGCIKVDMLYRNADASPVRLEKEIAYNDEVSLEYANDFESVSPRIEVFNLKSAVVPTDDGVRLAVTVGALTRVRATKNSLITLVSDAFLKERGTENEYSDFNYSEYVCSGCSEDKIELTQPLSDAELEGFGDILYSSAAARVDECEIQDNSVKIRGEVRFSGIACQVNENEERVFMPVKINAPFEQNVNINCQNAGNIRINRHVSVDDVRMEIDANHLSASANLMCCVSLSADRKKRCLGASYITDEEYTRDASVVTVYYPEYGENLFEIARKFHTSTRSIAESNRLTEAVFSSETNSLGSLGVDKLIIK